MEPKPSQPWLSIMTLLRCPTCSGPLEHNAAQHHLTCTQDLSHRFPIIHDIPTFVSDSDVSPQDAVYVSPYDRKPQWEEDYYARYDALLQLDIRAEFLRALHKLPIKPSSRVLDHSTGTGSQILALINTYRDFDCNFVGVDLSFEALRVAQMALSQFGAKVPLLRTANDLLPFRDDCFDITIHVGGINTFHDIPATLEECVRVLKPEGTLCIIDEGLSPALRKTFRGAELIKDSWAFGLQPPIDDLPALAKDIELYWIGGGIFYVITCRKVSYQELENINPMPFATSTRLSFYSKKCYPKLKGIR